VHPKFDTHAYNAKFTLLNYGKTWSNRGWWILNAHHKELIFLRKERTPRQGDKQFREKIMCK
jgi:hypothetical protein